MSASALKGKAEPRLFTPPLRPLTKETSLGYNIIAFAEMIGQPLLPWQCWLVIHAFELLPDGGLRFRIVLVLVARQNGKTHLSRVLILWRLYVFGSRLVLETAQDLSIAREVWEQTMEIAEDDPTLAKNFHMKSLQTGRLFFKAGAGRCMVRASNRKAARSLSVDHLNMDELRELRGPSGWQAWAALSKTTGAREDAQIWGFSNAGDDEAVVLNNLRAAAGVILGGDGVSIMGAARDASIFIAEWSGVEGCELDDWDAIRQANPGLGTVKAVAAVRTDLGTDPPAIFRTEVLCQKVDQLDGAFSLAAWIVCADATGEIAGDEKNRVLCLDTAPDGTHVALLGATKTADGRIAVQVVDAWPTVDECRADLRGIVKELKPRVFSWFPRFSAAMGADIRKLDKDIGKLDKGVRGMEIVELTGSQVPEACQAFAEQISSRWLVHSSDPLLDAHISGSKRLDTGDGWVLVRRGATQVNAAYAAAGAVHVLRNLPAPKPVLIPKVV